MSTGNVLTYHPVRATNVLNIIELIVTYTPSSSVVNISFVNIKRDFN